LTEKIFCLKVLLTTMSSTTFLNDFYTSDIMNHCELLKFMMNLGKDDALLLATTMEQLAKGESAGGQLHSIKPFYENHQNLPKNPVHILQAYVAVKELNEHQWNIYECAFLDSEKVWMVVVAFFTFIFQLMLFIVLVQYNIADDRHTEINADILIYVMAAGTSFFFANGAWNEIKEARNFNKAFKMLGVEIEITSVRGLMQIMNFTVNIIMSCLVPLFNVYFILLSEDPNDAILNSVALFFLLELDQMVAPDWSDNRIRDELAINSHDYCMIPLNPSELQVKKAILNQKLDSSEGDQYKDGDKLYVQVVRGNVVTIYQRVSVTSYRTITYEISGSRADEFLNTVCGFECLTNFWDLHD
jgi:hypothetical protein